MSAGAQSSESNSSMWNNSWSRAFSSMLSNSQSAQDAQSSSMSFVDQAQQPFLQSLYQQAMGAANPAATTAAATAGSGAVLPGMQGAFGALSGLMDTSGQIAAQEKSLKAGLGDLFRKELMPAIDSGAIASGGFGGGRQGVAQGVAAGEIADAFTAGRGDIVARANQTAMGAASLMPQMGQSIMQAFMAPSMAGLDPLARLAQIIGSPTILSKAGSTSTGRSSSSGSSKSRSRSEQNAGSESSSESSGWSFGLPKM